MSALPGRYLVLPDTWQVLNPGRAISRCTAATHHGVALWLWGRDVRDWVVYDGEVPYRFLTGDVDVIRCVLALHPADYVKHTLPIFVSWESMHRCGVGLALRPKGIVCVIGDGARVALPLGHKEDAPF